MRHAKCQHVRFCPWVCSRTKGGDMKSGSLCVRLVACPVVFACSPWPKLAATQRGMRLRHMSCTLNTHDNNTGLCKISTRTITRPSPSHPCTRGTLKLRHLQGPVFIQRKSSALLADHTTLRGIGFGWSWQINLSLMHDFIPDSAACVSAIDETHPSIPPCPGNIRQQSLTNNIIGL